MSGFIFRRLLNSGRQCVCGSSVAMVKPILGRQYTPVIVSARDWSVHAGGCNSYKGRTDKLALSWGIGQSVTTSTGIDRRD